MSASTTELPPTVLPPIGKISLIGIWIETVLYGINCVVYGLCMFILAMRGGKITTLRRVLIVSLTLIWILCTAHVGASLQQLLDAFVYAPADIPGYSTIYWFEFSSPLRMLKDDLYTTLVLAQIFILIWRLYVVFGCNWRVVIFPTILAACFAGPAYAASVVARSSEKSLYGSLTTTLIIIAWAFGCVLNVSITGAIVMRLWWMGRNTASFRVPSTNRFATSIYIIIESGAGAIACGTVVLALFVLDSPFALAGLDVISQVVVLIALLIVVQTGKAGLHSTSHSRNVSSLKRIRPVQDGIRFRAGDPRERDSREDVLPDIARSRSPSRSAHGVDV